MQTSQLIANATTCIDALPIDIHIKYMLLASFVSYFKTPLRQQDWNTFPSKLKQGVISVQTGINQSDEEKNSEFWAKVKGKQKTEAQQLVFQALLSTRDNLKRKKIFQANDLVAIPDMASPRSQPTLFPREYLKRQISEGNMENELTGQPLSWALVQELQKPSSQLSTPSNGRVLAGEMIATLIQKEVNQLKTYQEACIVCRKKSRQYKTLRDFQTIFFCSLKCMATSWDG